MKTRLLVQRHTYDIKLCTLHKGDGNFSMVDDELHSLRT